jgi:hypothetical protein
MKKEKDAPDPLFARAEQRYAEAVEQGRVAFEERLAEEEKKRGDAPGRRIDAFWPYLVVRSSVGDNGTRPLNVAPPWRSPDVWLWAGHPSTAPELPPAPLPSPGPLAWPNLPYFAAEGQDHTVYAHVWNLGRAPVGQAAVEFFRSSASLGTGTERIGVVRVDLPPRSSRQCHRLVKCPIPWRPALPLAHQGPPTSAQAWFTVSLVVRVSSFDDPPAESWDPAADRHLAAHDVLIQRST